MAGSGASTLLVAGHSLSGTRGGCSDVTGATGQASSMHGWRKMQPRIPNCLGPLVRGCCPE